MTDVVALENNITDIRTVVSGVPDNYCIAVHKVVEKFTSSF
jgi:hypothetical protein